MTEGEGVQALKSGQEMLSGPDAIGKASALLAMGAETHHPPVTNTYSKNYPYTPGKPGKVIYHFKPGLPDGGDVRQVLGHWGKESGGQRFDELLGEVESVRLRADIKNAAREMVMEHIAAAFEWRDEVAGMWRKVRPMAWVPGEGGGGELIDLKKTL